MRYVNSKAAVQEKVLFGRPKWLRDVRTHYCPGCGHGVVHRIVAEVIEELDIRDRTIGIAPVGCAVLAYDYIDCDMIEVAHGRAPAVATGMKRARPECIIFSYQGDGDLASIGAAEILHAANRGEKITVIFVNNAVYGMTGGQMAPTTLLGQRTATTPFGRDAEYEGYPLRIVELLSSLPGVVYAARGAIIDPGNVRKVKKYIRQAFQMQIDGKGFSIVEVLSPCPSQWKVSPVEALEWIREKMLPEYPLGELKGGKNNA